jgi:hypothetical protein
MRTKYEGTNDYTVASGWGSMQETGLRQRLKPRSTRNSLGSKFLHCQQRLNRLRKNSRARKKQTSGAKGPSNLNDLSARLKVVPFPKPLEQEFLRKL